MKQYRVTLLLALVSLFSVFCAKEDATTGQDVSLLSLVEKSTLTVAMDLSFPPFETVDKQGTPLGISVDMAQDLAKELGLVLKIENVAWAGLIPGLIAGKYDMVLSSMTITNERKESIDFSVPYARIGLGILFSKASGLTQVSDLKRGNPRVIVRKGTVAESVVTNSFPNASMLAVDNMAVAMLEVSQNKADATLYDPLTIYEGLKTYPNSTIADLRPVEGTTGEWAIGIKKGNTQLKARVDQFITAYKAKGAFDILGDKYLKEIKLKFEKEGIPFFFS